MSLASTTPSPDARMARVPGNDLAGVATIAAFGVLACAAVVRLWPAEEAITSHFFARQDVFVAAAFALLLLLIGRTPARAERLWRAVPMETPAVRWMAFLGAGAFIYLGARVLLMNFALSRDEDMAEFDARIFQAGRLMAMVPEEWRAYFPAFGSIYMVRVAGQEAWASNYLPGAAAIRALFGVLGDRALSGAALAVLALACVHGCARKLFPARPDAAVVASLTLLLSAQFLITAMTPYAMTAHLALNALWLWLYVRDTRLSHAGAAATGFLATGLHQILFHPLFAAPFILQAWFGGRRALACFYTAAYAAIGLFWLNWFRLDLFINGLPAASLEPAQTPFATALMLVSEFEAANVSMMLSNLIRFVVWQPVATLPLIVAGGMALRRAPPTLVSLAAGVGLTLMAMFVLMPNQGYGWGYRYVHGVLVSIALLSAWGWISIGEALERADATRLRAAVGLAMALSAIVFLPLRLWQARQVVVPFAAASEAIAASPADVVFVDVRDNYLTVDLVRNDPFLRNKPVTLELGRLSLPRVEALCARYRIATFDKEQAERFGIEAWARTHDQYNARVQAARERMQELGCGAPVQAAR